MIRKTLVGSVMMLSLLTAMPQAHAGSHTTGAILGGVAAGVVGGAVLGTVLNQQARPAPVYVAPPPPPTVEYVEPAPRRVYVARPADPYMDQLDRLHFSCDDGNRHACIRFGILIGQHRERVAEWRRSHPDYFSYED